MEDLFNTPAYKRSRKAYCAQCAFEYFVSILLADAYLAKLLSSAGISDSTIGIISSLITCSFMIELAAIPLMQRIRNAKKTVIIYDFASITLFACTYLLPFINIGKTMRTVLAFVCVGGGFALKYVVISLYFAWANSFVHPNGRGRYSAVKEMISLISGIVFTLVMGFAVDKFESTGNLKSAFILIAAVIIILNMLSLACLLMIARERPQTLSKDKKSVSEILRAVLGNRGFVGVIIMTSIWSMARYSSQGFMGTFKTQELLFTVGAVQVINVFGCLCRFGISIPFGKYSDKTSYANGFCMSMYVLAAAFLCAVFTNTNSRWLIVGYSVLYEMSFAGSWQNSYNMAYSYMKEEYIVQAMAVKDCICGIVGFAVSLIASRVLTAVQNAGNMVFGMNICGQQLLNAVSLVLTIATIVYVKKSPSIKKSNK